MLQIATTMQPQFTVETRSPRRIFCHPYQWSFVYNIIQHVTHGVSKDTLQLCSDAAGCVVNITDSEYKEIQAHFGNLWDAYELNVQSICHQAFLRVAGLTNHFTPTGIVEDGRTPEKAAELIERMMPLIDKSYFFDHYKY